MYTSHVNKNYLTLPYLYKIFYTKIRYHITGMRIVQAKYFSSKSCKMINEPSMLCLSYIWWRLVSIFQSHNGSLLARVCIWWGWGVGVGVHSKLTFLGKCVSVS